MKKKKNYTFSECILTAGAAIMVLSMAALSAKQMTSAQIQAAACSSSLRTIGQAIASYAADYKDDLPHSVNYHGRSMRNFFMSELQNLLAN